MLSLLQGSESSHGKALSDYIDWCDMSSLDLNVCKTKEMVFDFRKNTVKPSTSVVHGEEVEIVHNYKYFGTVFDSSLKFDMNTDLTIRKEHQRIHLLRKLNSFNVSQSILCNFYHSFIKTL